MKISFFRYCVFPQSNPITIQTTGGLISIPSYTRSNYPSANNSLIRMPRTSVGNLITGRGSQPLSASIKETSVLKKSLTLITKDSLGKETPIRIVNANFGEAPASFNIGGMSEQIPGLDKTASKSLVGFQTDNFFMNFKLLECIRYNSTKKCVLKSFFVVVVVERLKTRSRRIRWPKMVLRNRHLNTGSSALMDVCVLICRQVGKIFLP